MRLNKVCNIEDFSDEEFLEVLKRAVPHYFIKNASFPKNLEDRKPWEWAMGIYGMEKLNCLHPDALVLGVACGSEPPIYYLTKKVKFVFATDLYGGTKFAKIESPITMLITPEVLAPFPFNRNRLIVRQMDATKITFDDNVFDCVFSFSSIEHLGDGTKVTKAIQEMARVVKPGGILAISTEFRLNSASGGTETFSKDEIMSLIVKPSGCELVEEIDFDISDATLANITDIQQACEDVKNRQLYYSSYPHIVLRDHGVLWTSIIFFLRK